jgi:hypothetical protein
LSTAFDDCGTWPGYWQWYIWYIITHHHPPPGPGPGPGPDPYAIHQKVIEPDYVKDYGKLQKYLNDGYVISMELQSGALILQKSIPVSKLIEAGARTLNAKME